MSYKIELITLVQHLPGQPLPYLPAGFEIWHVGPMVGQPDGSVRVSILGCKHVVDKPAKS